MSEGIKCWNIPFFTGECRSQECGGICRICEHDDSCYLCPYYGCLKYPLIIKAEGEIK